MQTTVSNIQHRMRSLFLNVFSFYVKSVSSQQQQQQHHQSMQSGHTENRLSGSNTPLTPSSSIEPRFPPTPGTTNPSGGVSGGGAQAGSTFPIPSSPQTPTTVTTNPSSAPNLGNYFTNENISLQFLWS